jgi:hypothetical protein
VLYQGSGWAIVRRGRVAAAAETCTLTSDSSQGSSAQVRSWPTIEQQHSLAVAVDVAGAAVAEIAVAAIDVAAAEVEAADVARCWVRRKTVADMLAHTD